MHFTRLARLRAAALATGALVLGLAACSSGRLGVGLPRPPHQPGDGRPNIVFVLTDDLSTNLLPYMPHVRALMAAGTSFRNYFVVDSLCCPSRAAIFTGLYPHDDGVYTNGGSHNMGQSGGYHAYDEHHNPRKSFAVALQASGYRTGFMGKYLNGYPPSAPEPPGWDEWDGTGRAYQEYNYDLNEDGTVHHYGHDPQDYLTHVLAGKANAFVRMSASVGKPFALEVATFAPHRPATPAPMDHDAFPNLRAPRGPAFGRHPTDAPPWLSQLHPLTSADDRSIDAQFRKRVESVQAVDRMVGRLERTLATVHELKNTYFVFSSDNGYHMGEYGLAPGKQTAFDTDIKVPLVVSGPGVPAGATISAMASSIDLAPTFLQIAGARPKATQDGVSLLDLLHGERPPADWQRAVLIEHRGPGHSPHDPDRQSRAAGGPPSYEAVRTPDFLYVEYLDGRHEYYDLTRDRYELHNIAGKLSKQRLATLHQMVTALANCHGTAACQRAATVPGI